MKLLTNNKYEYNPNTADDKRKFFSRRVLHKEKERRVHLHLTSNKETFNSFIAFRYYLIKHNDVRDEYAKIKKEGSKISRGNKEKYNEQKMDFLTETAKKAILELK